MNADDESMASELNRVELSDGRTVHLEESLQRGPDEFGLGAYHDGELIGLLVCESDRSHNGHLVVFVRPEWRGVGVGTALMRTMAARASAFGLTYLTLSYRVGNLEASRMIAASGMVVARRKRDGVEKVALLVPAATAATSERAA